MKFRFRNCLAQMALITAFAAPALAQSFPPALTTNYRNSIISFDRSPSVATDPTGTHTGLWMAYGSTVSNDYIYISNSTDGVNWTNVPISTLKRGFSPAIAFLNGNLWVAFVSDGGAGLINGALYLGYTNNPASGLWTVYPQLVTLTGSAIYPTNSPTLAVFNGQIWVNETSQSGSNYFNDTFATSNGTTYTGATGCPRQDSYAIDPNASIAMIEWQNLMYFAYRTNSSAGNILRVCTTDGAINNPTMTFLSPGVNPAGSGVSAVIYGNYLTFAYKNLNSNNQVIVGTPNGGSYTQDEYATSMNGSSEITPAVAVYGSTYYMLYTAPATDHHLWTSHN